MFITNTTVLGGRGFSVGGGGGVLKYATGYPLTLAKTLPKPPESITVYGNTGGVGDYDSTKQAYKIPILSQGRNLFDKDNAWVVGGYINNSKLISYNKTVGNFGTLVLPIKPSSTYTVSRQILGARFTVGVSEYEPAANIAMTRTKSGNSSKSLTITAGENDTYLYVWFYNGQYDTDTYQQLLEAVQIEVGSTATPYEPYINKTINLYSDAPILLGDDLRVYPEEKKAYRGTTDISSLQDWTQDWKLPKSEELTVTAGTEVEPSNMEILYYGKR